jgi:hypothetical protein
MKTFLMIIILMWGGVNQVFADEVKNVNPDMTFGSMPVVGLLFNSFSTMGECTTNGNDSVSCGATIAAGQVKTHYYTGCNCGWQVAGFSCPANTASISVDGFDFTKYNGWDGIYHTNRFNIFTGREEIYTVTTLCVVPQ